MIAVDVPVQARGTRAGRVRMVLADTLVVTRRNLRRIRRTPRLLAVSSIHPTLFLLLFRYVFGGAIHTKRLSYADYLVPGLLVAITLFGSTTAVAMAADLSGGMIDRFRSLPMARSAVLAGRCLADVTRGMFVVTILLMVGTLTGFRFHNGVLPAIAAIALVLVFSFSFSWVFALVGLLVKDPQTAQLAAFLPVFPFMFASTVFVPLSSMPGWLQAFAKFQPVSITVDAVRVLAEGGKHLGLFLAISAVWMILFFAVFGSLAISRYRKS